MFYKNWPYWLKGGAISSIVFLILIVGVIFIMPLLVVIPPLIFLKIIGFNCPILGTSCKPPLPVGYSNEVWVFALFLGWLSVFTVTFLPGAIIGFIYGKIKNRNKV